MYSKSLTSTFTWALVSFLAMFVSVSFAAPIAIRRSTAIAGRQDTTSSGTTYSGDGTWYETGLGACGITNTDGDAIVAAAWQTFDEYPNPICNKQVTMYYGGKSVTATITDRCAGCAGAADLDMSPSLFDTLVGDPGIGRVSITWHYS
ncbi:RlpA-like double-psi beta-barrel-protein domain-containing protein-containing protein [Lentinula boryana]|uniref:RlpA-like double-psi beta-barrel-protein domain-containing protein-containing protein n=1 Tax=Lentinula boryana TaxID=40481 RepID=A0ABQ8Q002_9AGAR|nr:RlpA-like double-psi beta-barrel-protein domain-containing protein-containing protein [Lentinula boryana]